MNHAKPASLVQLATHKVKRRTQKVNRADPVNGRLAGDCPFLWLESEAEVPVLQRHLRPLSDRPRLP